MTFTKKLNKKNFIITVFVFIENIPIIVIFIFSIFNITILSVFPTKKALNFISSFLLLLIFKIFERFDMIFL